LEEIGCAAFSDCSSLLAVYFPKSLQRIGDFAFDQCHSLISAELPPTVQVHDRAFFQCYTLELRQPQVDYNSLAYQQQVQRSRESIRWLKVRNDEHPIHKICNDTNTAIEQLQSTINSNNNNNINHALQQTDDLGMTALHALCLNPSATPEMLKMIANSFPQAATMQAVMATNDHGGRIMVTPIKLLMKVKGISYDDNDFDEQGLLTHNAAFQKGLEWNDLSSIMSIHSFNLGAANESNHLYPFMQAATINGMKLETLYHLAMYDLKLIYQQFQSFETEPPRKRTRNV
jgi:hypothetical protein